MRPLQVLAAPDRGVIPSSALEVVVQHYAHSRELCAAPTFVGRIQAAARLHHHHVLAFQLHEYPAALAVATRLIEDGDEAPLDRARRHYLFFR